MSQCAFRTDAQNDSDWKIPIDSPRRIPKDFPLAKEKLHVASVASDNSCIRSPQISAGKLSDRISKLTMFVVGSCWAIVLTIIYTNLSPISLWILIIINISLFAGVLSRSIPATAMISSIPDVNDRGAFMSINACLQQFAGGLAAAVSGLIVTQYSPNSPIVHFNVLGYVSACIMLISMWMMTRVSSAVRKKKENNKMGNHF